MSAGNPSSSIHEDQDPDEREEDIWLTDLISGPPVGWRYVVIKFAMLLAKTDGHRGDRPLRK